MQYRKITSVVLLCCVATSGLARDRGQYAQSDPKTKAWFEGLRSKKGPCCSDADGVALADVDWESKDGHYRVRIPSEPYLINDKPAPGVWVVVPDDAVINEPNRIGRTMVWPIYPNQYVPGITIRCFMPGSMT